MKVKMSRDLKLLVLEIIPEEIGGCIKEKRKNGREDVTIFKIYASGNSSSRILN